MNYKQKRKGVSYIPAVLVTVIAIVVTVLFVVRTSGESQGYRTISVIEVSGRVGVVKDGIEYSAYPGMLLQEGHEIVTMGDGYVRLVLDGDKYIKVEAGSKLVFETLGMLGSGKTKLCLERGAITSELVAPLGEDEEFVVNTPNAVLAVRGTYFRVELYRTENGDLLADVMTYGGMVTSNRVLPHGEILEEDVPVGAGFKALINMNTEETVYVVDSAEAEPTEPGSSVAQVVTMPIRTEDVPDEDLVDIYYAAENGHDLFMTAAEVKKDIEARDIDMEAQTSVYEKAEEIKAEQEQAEAAAFQGKNTTDVMVVANDKQPLSRVEEQESNNGVDNKDYVGESNTAAPSFGYLGDGAGTMTPTVAPTEEPTVTPTVVPTMTPAVEPSVTPTIVPTPESTVIPTIEPTVVPTIAPTSRPAVTPTTAPTAAPTAEPTVEPTEEPTATPTVAPTAEPTVAPTAVPTAEPTATPTVVPTAEPTATPTAAPTATPTVAPTATPTVVPTAEPTATPTAVPTAAPTATPTPEPHTHTPEFAGESGVHSKCGECGEVLETTHAYTERQTTSPTCTTVGEKTYTCDCGYKYTEEIPATGHTEVDGAEADIHVKCSVCGTPIEDGSAHDYAEEVTTEASCTTAGERTYTCGCGYSYTEEIPATGHTEVDGAEAGIHVKCSVCGTPIEDGSAHDYAEEVTTEASCTTAGERTYTCGCGYSYTEEIPATGHTEVDGAEADIHVKCSVCGTPIEDGSAHDYVEEITTEASCTTAGERTYTCACGYSYTETIPKTGHDPVYGGTAEAHYKCNTCGVVTNNSHDFTETGYVEATCTTNGSRTSSCPCGYEFTDTIAASGHNYILDKEYPGAGNSGNGKQYERCTYCNDVINEEVLIGINNTNFPDGTMQVIAGNYDRSYDGMLSSEEIAAVTEMYINYGGCTNTKGLELFTSLTTLNVCDYALTSLDLSELTNLTSLNITDSINITSLDLSTLTNLQSLNISRSGITSMNNITWPTDGNMISVLDISRTELTDIDLSGFTALTELHAREANLDDTGMVAISGIPNPANLEVLDISGNSITSLDLADFTGLKSLYIIGNTGITTMPDVSGCADLEVLAIGHTGITDFTMDALSNNDNLKTLDLSGLNITSLDLSNHSGIISLRVEGCDALETLTLSEYSGMRELFCKNTALTTLDVSNLTYLQALDISYTNISDFDSMGLDNLSELTYFNAEYANLDDNDWSVISSKLPTLLYDLYIGGNAITNLDNLSQYTGLCRLDLSGLSGVTEIDLSSFTSLNYLNVSNTGISALNLEANRYLFELRMSGLGMSTVDLSALTGLGVLAVEDCTALSSLDLTNNTGLYELYVSGCTSLTNLDLTNQSMLHRVSTGGRYPDELTITGLNDVSIVN